MSRAALVLVLVLAGCAAEPPAVPRFEFAECQPGAPAPYAGRCIVRQLREPK